MARNSLFGATVMLLALAIVTTWPQALHVATAVPDHDDPFLSMWRLGWIAHALSGGFRHLFDANIFYPNVRTLAYSDATLLEGLIAAPWLLAGGNLVLAYNMLVFIGIVSSGIGMFALMRRLTNDADAALVSAAIFALAPYRIEHFMHLELQWTMWMPLTFWAVHRVFEERTVRRGLTLGGLLALQVLSCLYYGIYLGMIAAALCVLLVLFQPVRAKFPLLPLLVAAGVTAAVTLGYALPYLANAHVLGTRDPAETASFSAQLASYFTAPEQNWLWGWTAFRFDGNERHLFPGLVTVVLAAVAVAGSSRRKLVWIYLSLAALTVELSLGMNGTLYRWLHDLVWALQGFRAPARFGILAVCCLAILAGLGFQFIQQRFSTSRLPLVVVLVAIALESAAAPIRLADVPPVKPDLYKFLSTGDSRSPVIELPIIDWSLNPFYMFWSTQHWRPLVNGYSGYIPRDYEETLKRMRKFPDDASIGRLQALNVRQIVVHEYFFSERERSELILAMLQRPELAPGGRFRDWIGTAQVFELKPASAADSAWKK